MEWFPWARHWSFRPVVVVGKPLLRLVGQQGGLSFELDANPA